MCVCRRLGLWRLFMGVVGPDDPADEGERERWRERRRRFRATVRQAFRQLLSDEEEPHRAESRTQV